MQKTDFITAMADYAERFGDVQIIPLDKPDEHYQGLTIKKDTPSAVLNLDQLYNDYLNGVSLNQCYRIVEHVLTLPPPENIDKTIVTDWEKAKTRLEVRMFEENPGGLYDEMDGFYFVPYITVIKNGGVRVTQEILDLWDNKVSFEEVCSYAALNEAKKRGMI